MYINHSSPVGFCFAAFYNGYGLKGLHGPQLEDRMTAPLYTRPTERRRRDIPQNPVEEEKGRNSERDQKRDFPSVLMARCEMVSNGLNVPMKPKMIIQMRGCLR